MPPKKQPPPTANKPKKAAVDPTFGMKNKKGKKGQAVQQQFSNSQSSAKQDRLKAEQAAARKAEKQARWDKEEEAAALYKKVEEKQKPQVCPIGVDPQSILCVYFKNGFCQLADKCKFSHDFGVENKTAMKDMYTDTRELSNIEMVDMKEWDEDTLRAVLKKKEIGRPPNASQQVCKHFIKAIEDNKWGWFWECPNGNNTCIYRHALPPDYVLKKNLKKDKSETRTIEEVLEEERGRLTGTGTKVTPETFAVWFAKIKQEKEKEAKKVNDARQQDLRSGKLRMTGRELLQSGKVVDNEEPEQDDGEIDLLALKKQRDSDEMMIDEENAKIAAEYAKEVEEQLADEEQIILNDDNADKLVKINNSSIVRNCSPKTNGDHEKNEIVEAEKAVLDGVDVSLFKVDAEGAEDEDIEFSDEEM
jgi:hypothetical protein